MNYRHSQLCGNYATKRFKKARSKSAGDLGPRAPVRRHTRNVAHPHRIGLCKFKVSFNRFDAVGRLWRELVVDF